MLAADPPNEVTEGQGEGVGVRRKVRQRGEERGGVGTVAAVLDISAPSHTSTGL